MSGSLAGSSPEPSHSPCVSVVTVCLNAEAHIRGALESVLMQTYSQVEHIVVDGGSTDGTVDIIREFELQFDGRLRWTSEPDDGLYDAMNKGVAMATGSLIGTLNSDDTYELDAIARTVAVWERYPDAGVLYGDLRVFDATRAGRVLEAPGEPLLRKMRRDMVLYHPATFVSAGTYAAVGAYETTYRIAADYDLLLRALEAGVYFAKVPGVLVDFSLAGLSNRAVREADREATRVRIAHGVNPVFAWARFYKRALASGVYGALSRDARFRGAYDRYKGAR